MPERSGEDRWRRFTILDATILVASAAVGLWLAGPEEVRWWMAPWARLAVALLAGIAIGGLVAGPAILASQWAFRDRRRCPTPGEILGLSSSMLMGASIAFLFVVATISRESAVGLLVLMAAMNIQGVIALVAFVYLISRFGTRSRPRFPGWTDVAGAVAGILAGLWVLADIASALSQL